MNSTKIHLHGLKTGVVRYRQEKIVTAMQRY